MKNILCVITNWRVFEKYTDLILEMSNEFKLDLYFMGQASTNTIWPGDKDLRKEYQIIASQRENITIFESEGISRFGMSVPNPFMQFINKFKNYSAIWYDDNRPLPTYAIGQLYNAAKHYNIPVIGNSHGNQDFDPKHQSGLGTVMDHVFLLSQNEKDYYSKFYDSKTLHIGGIPTNDSLKNIEIKEDYILCITNFLANHNPIIFPTNFDKAWASVLESLSIYYNLPIVIKQKGRLDDPNYYKNIDFINNQFTKIKPIIITDSENINELIGNAKYVISALSTLSFKALQLKKPTILISGTGQVGNFKNYPYILSLDIKDIKDKINNFKEVNIEKIISGYDFTAINKYIENFKKIINGKR